MTKKLVIIGLDKTEEKRIRKLSILLSTFSFSALAIYIIQYIDTQTFYFMTAVINAGVIAIVNLIFFFIKPGKWMTLFHGGTILTIGIITTTIGSPENYAGMLLVNISIVFLAKSGLFKKKIFIFTLFIIIMLYDCVYSYIIQRAGIDLLIGKTGITAGTFLLIYFAFYKEIENILLSVGKLKKSLKIREKLISSLRSELLLIRKSLHNEIIKKIEYKKKSAIYLQRIKELEDTHSPINLKSYNISEREAEVLKQLVLTKAKNRIIAMNLDIKESTIKTHIYNICNKTGVDTRLELIELFRHNWPPR